jgi:hypothetical protein
LRESVIGSPSVNPVLKVFVILPTDIDRQRQDDGGQECDADSVPQSQGYTADEQENTK